RSKSGHRAFGIFLIRLRPTEESLDFFRLDGSNLLGFELSCLGWLRPRYELVPNSWYRQKESGDLRIRLDLAPHPGDKHVDAAVEGVHATPRNGVPQLVTRYNLPRTAC